MRRVYLVTSVIAALVAGTIGAPAQGFADDPPGWAFQKRGIIEMNGGNPFRYGYRYGYRTHRARGAYAWGYHHRFRHHRYRYR